MHDINADARFDYLGLDTRSQWISRGKQYVSYGIQTAHGGRLMHDRYAPVCLDDLDCDFENVFKARAYFSPCFLLQNDIDCKNVLCFSKRRHSKKFLLLLSLLLILFYHSH